VGALPALLCAAAHLSIERIGVLAAIYPATQGFLQLVTGARQIGLVESG